MASVKRELQKSGMNGKLEKKVTKEWGKWQA